MGTSLPLLVQLACLPSGNDYQHMRLTLMDQDGDGHYAIAYAGDPDAVPADDCDDSDASVNPSQPEIAYDSKDNDCDPSTPDNDLDGDGHAHPDDCDDSDPAINAEAEETWYDDVDQDCAGEHATGRPNPFAIIGSIDRGAAVSDVAEAANSDPTAVDDVAGAAVGRSTVGLPGADEHVVVAVTVGVE